MALAIHTPLGVIIHTGDFKVDPTPTDNRLFDLHAFAEYGKEGVLALFQDSTNVERTGYTPSERACGGSSTRCSRVRSGGFSSPAFHLRFTASSWRWKWRASMAARWRSWAAR